MSLADHIHRGHTPVENRSLQIKYKWEIVSCVEEEEEEPYLRVKCTCINALVLKHFAYILAICPPKMKMVKKW